MIKQTRRKFSASFKSNVCIEALKEHRTLEELSKKYEIHPVQISAWKKEFLSNSASVFEKGKSSEEVDKDDLIQALYAQIGEQKVAIDFLKKKLL